jgi:hypothetical protein
MTGLRSSDKVALDLLLRRYELPFAYFSSFLTPAECRIRREESSRDLLRLLRLRGRGSMLRSARSGVLLSTSLFVRL